MQKKQNIFIIIITVAVAIILPVFIGITIQSVNKQVTDSCFVELENSAKRLGDELYNTTNMDRTILTAMSEIIGNSGKTDDATLCEIMNSYNNSSSFLSYVELLRPDGTMLQSDGTIHDATSGLDFQKEGEKGFYISGIVESTLDSGEEEIRNAVPVEKDGQVIYMLYGVVRLEDFADKYKTDIYEGHAYVYLEDGDTGDFLLDTWHKTLGNIRDVSKRKMLPGYDFTQAMEDMSIGKSGQLGFISESTGEILYMYYAPVGVNNWNVVITVQKQYAMEESDGITSSLLKMSAVIGVVVLGYMLVVLINLFRAYKHVRKIGMEDHTTSLQNRNAYDVYMTSHRNVTFDNITCVYLDANGLHEVNNKYGHQVGDQMLRIIAEALKSQFHTKEIYRIGGDEFVVFTEDADLETNKEKMKQVTELVEAQDYYISYGIVCRNKEMGVDRLAQEADEMMLEHKKEYYAQHDRRGRR